MVSGFGQTKDKDGNIINFFHDDINCIDEEGHKWDGNRYAWDYCEDPDHENLTDDEHEAACLKNPDNPLCKGPSGSEAFCVKCGMGMMHYCLMTAD